MLLTFRQFFWKHVNVAGLLLVLNGFIKALKFGEAYLPQYLTQDKGIPLQTIYDHVFPVWTYSYLAFLIPVALLSGRSFGGYRGLVWLEAVMDALTYGLLYWAQGLPAMQAMQVTFGLSTAASVGFFSAVTALFPPEDTMKWNGFIRASTLVGHVIGSLCSQWFLYLGMPMSVLFLMTFIALLIGFVISWFFPKKGPSTLEALKDPEATEGMKEPAVEEIAVLDDDKESVGFITSSCQKFKRIFGNVDILLLSWCSAVFYASLCLTESYVSAIWYEHYLYQQAKGDPNFVVDTLLADPNVASASMNGVMDALGKAFGAAGAMLAGYIPADPQRSYNNNMRFITLLLLPSFIVFGLSILGLGLFYQESLWIPAVSFMVMMSVGYALVSYISGVLALQVLEKPEDHPFMLGTQTFVSMIFQTLLLALSESFSLRMRFCLFSWINGASILAIFLYHIYKVLKPNNIRDLALNLFLGAAAFVQRL